MAVSTDVNDPSFGLETDQSSPNFGLAPEQPKPEEGGIVHSIVSEGKSLAGQAVGLLNPLNLVRGVLDIQPRSGLQEVLRTGRLLKDIVGGMPVGEAVRQEAPEVAQQQEAIMGKHGSEAQHEALGAIGTQLGMVAAPFIHGKIIPLREIAGFKAPEVAPEVMPAGTPSTFAPAEEPYNHETGLQVMPETRFQMVDEPPPEIAPSRNIMETARYQPTFRPGEETPLASDAFPSISRSAEESRRAARTVDTGIESETARVGGEPEPLVIPEVNTPASLEEEAKSVTGNAEVPDFNPNAAKSPQEVAPSPEAEGATTPVPLPKTEAPSTGAVVSTPETAAKSEPVGIAERYREDELGSGSVIPGVGKTPAEARDWGHDFINKGGNPYDLVNKKGPKKELWQEVGGVRAEYERLSNLKREAEAALESNPNDPMSQMAFDNADAAQRQWSKDMQPVLTRAGDALRAASRAYPREINSFSDFTDILHDHYGGEVELTPVKRAEIQKLVKATKQVNGEANGAREAVVNETVKKAGGKVLPFEELKADLRGAMEELLKDCPV